MGRRLLVLTRKDKYHYSQISRLSSENRGSQDAKNPTLRSWNGRDQRQGGSRNSYGPAGPLWAWGHVPGKLDSTITLPAIVWCEIPQYS